VFVAVAVYGRAHFDRRVMPDRSAGRRRSFWGCRLPRPRRTVKDVRQRVDAPVLQGVASGRRSGGRDDLVGDVSVARARGAEVARALRIAMTASLAIGIALALLGFVAALRDFENRSRANSSVSELDRRYGDWLLFPTIIRDRGVVEYARATMPETARYRILIGSAWTPVLRTRWTRSIEEDFLRFYLLPRRQTHDLSTPWVICLACNTTVLGRDVDVLRRGSNGMLFLRGSR
jgi:hypothetical protein